jgi:zinc-finger of transposase IS204/IS1001/IS1096/IS1165/Transposase
LSSTLECWLWHRLRDDVGPGCLLAGGPPGSWSCSPCDLEVLSVLFPHLAGVLVERVFLAGRTVRIRVRASGSKAACPACGTVSRRVHSRYERRLSDLAVAGQEVILELAARRFFCGSAACGKATFAEQVLGLTARYGRRSAGLTEVLRAVALALGGRAGARMSARVAAEVSRVTMIRLIRALPGPAAARAPRVLGVDEFAVRRGHSYGTLLVDIETRRPVDILPERSAGSFAAWLAARPGTELICRDRGGCYADGGARGAPDAIQAADRWHLWHNLSDAAERAVARHSACLRAAAPVPSATRPPQPAGTRTQAPPGQVRSDRIAVRTRQRHAVIRQLAADGRTVRDIAAELGLARNTVRRSPAPRALTSSSSMTAPAAAPASWTSTRPTCASGGTPAAPTPPSCTGSCVPAVTRAATP